MSDSSETRSKAEVLAILRRTGVGEETIEMLDAELGDPVDLRRDGDVLFRYGITRERLEDRMGGSP